MRREAAADVRRRIFIYHSLETSEEAMEITGAYLQYFYRETANYLERTSHGSTCGVDTRSRRVLDDKGKRQELNKRLDDALSVIKDPWKTITEDEK